MVVFQKEHIASGIAVVLWDVVEIDALLEYSTSVLSYLLVLKCQGYIEVSKVSTKEFLVILLNSEVK